MLELDSNQLKYVPSYPEGKIRMTVADRAAPRLAGIFGVKFPVRDLVASRAWYEKVFGLTLESEFPDDDGVVRGVAYSAPGSATSGSPFASGRTSRACRASTP